MYEVVLNKESAINLAKVAYDEAMKIIDDLDKTKGKETILLIQLLKENLSLWFNDNEEDIPTQEKINRSYSTVFNSPLINAKIETKIPFNNINKSNSTVIPEETVTFYEREEKIRKIKKQLEDEGTELAKNVAPIIAGVGVFPLSEI
jgi:dsDNA-binding SOS-regulon protein